MKIATNNSTSQVSNVQMPTDRTTRSSATTDDLANYFKNSLYVEDDYDSNWQGVETSETGPWYIVEHKVNRKKVQLKKELVRINEAIESCCDELLTVPQKEYDGDKYFKHRQKRKNRKEERRRQARERILHRNERLAVSPHGDEQSGTDVEQRDVGLDEFMDYAQRDVEQNKQRLAEQGKKEYIESTKVNMRNMFARAALEAPPQSVDSEDESEELASLLSSIQVPDSLCGDNEDVSNWISYLENLVILGYQISRADSFLDVFVAVVGYVKMHTQKSVIKEILLLIDEVASMTSREDVEPHGMNAHDIMQKWECFKTNTIFTKVSYLISAAMSLTVCTVKEIEWSPLGLKLISLEAAKAQLKAVDVIDALISTFTWVAETGYRVFEEKSLLPLLYSDAKMQKFNEDCDYVLAHADSVLAGNGGCVEDFEHKCDDVLRQVSELKAVKSTGPTAIWLQQRYSQLVDIKYKIVGKHRNTAIRFAPFGVGLTGPSGVGKSTLSKLVMKTSLHAMGFETDPKRIITKDMFDKYDSTYTSDILGMFMDDVGNGKAEFAQVSPTDVIIKFFNNMAAQAVKAELNAKGVVFIAFKVGVITSNFADYQVRCYANKPEAALRRFVHTRVRVKPEYRVHGGVSLNTDHPGLDDCDLCQDVWELDLEECFLFETTEGYETYEFRTLEVRLDDGRLIKCKDLDLPTYLDVIIHLAKRHKVKQTNVVERSEAFDVMDMCSKCYRPQPMCKCVDPHALEVLGDLLVNSVQESLVRYMYGWFYPLELMNSLIGYWPVRKMATKHLARELDDLMNGLITPWAIALTPNFVFQTHMFQKSIELWQHSAALYDARRYFKWLTFFGFLLFVLGLYTCNLFGILGALFVVWMIKLVMWSHYRARVRAYQAEYMERRDALPELAQRLRDSHIAKGAIVVSTLLVGLKLFQLWNRKRLEEVTPDAGISPKDMEESPGWFGFMMKRMGVKVDTSESSKRAHPTHIIQTLEKSNLFWAEFKRADGSMTRCNIFFPRKSVAWFPEHVFYNDANMDSAPTSLLVVTVYRHNRPGGIFTFKSELGSCSTLPDLDMVCAYVPNCPDLRDKIKWLPESQPSGVSMCTFMLRKQDGVSSERISVQHGHVGHRYREFYGGHYTSSLARVGACMGPIVLVQKEPVLIGFHIGGNPTSNYGVMQTITQSMAIKLIDKLEAMPGIYLSASATDLPTEQYGRPVMDSEKVHPQCMAAKLDAHAFVDLLGSTKLRTMQKSEVKQSIISESVTKYTGVRNKWGPPMLIPNWKGFNATLEHIVNPADMFAPSALERARQDWLQPLFKAMKEYVKTEDFRPLTEREMVLGVPGKRFLDALPMNTGMGFPIFGKKEKHFEEVREGEALVDRIPSPDVCKEMHRCNECWKRGERAYPVASATLKDTATLIGEEKVRVFQAVAVAFGLYIRKYFLPVARFLSLHPLLSESAVGVNAFSHQWEELMAHANTFADDERVIAWDYSKYDVRMNSQVTRAVLASFIDLAEVGGYDKESLYIMKNMIVDLVHPVLDYNGTLMTAYNMNTSGNNITVNINSTAGSLFVRMGFFHVYPHESCFRSRVAAMTYGDDFKGSVHPDFRNFDFFSFRQFLAEHGMKITLPDKSDDEVAFMMDEDADFLKRKSNFIPEINRSIGALDENSIFKSLHANLLSHKVLPETVSISCIETAMHEWFAHGREVYELRATQMKKVCEETQLPVPAVYATYDERVQRWLEKYSS